MFILGVEWNNYATVKIYVVKQDGLVDRFGQREFGFLSFSQPNTLYLFLTFIYSQCWHTHRNKCGYRSFLKKRQMFIPRGNFVTSIFRL